MLSLMLRVPRRGASREIVLRSALLLSAGQRVATTAGGASAFDAAAAKPAVGRGPAAPLQAQLCAQCRPRCGEHRSDIAALQHRAVSLRAWQGIRARDAAWDALGAQFRAR